MQMVAAAGFWSMPTKEQDKSVNGRKTYELDASTCIVEGVSNGSFHVVFRRGPAAGPFADVISFLAWDLAGMDRLSGWPSTAKALEQTP
ncbi:MAG: hypothetical protein WA192_13700 [Candidatus Acidiferrales bacterium]